MNGVKRGLVVRKLVVRVVKRESLVLLSGIYRYNGGTVRVFVGWRSDCTWLVLSTHWPRKWPGILDK